MPNLAIFIVGSIVTGLCITFLVMTLYGIHHAQHLSS